MAPRLHTKGEYPADWEAIAKRVKSWAEWRCVRCAHPHDPVKGRTLTVHHFDGDKSNCAEWNLIPLCQACHLSVQARVNPETPYIFMPSIWIMPYIAGFYAAGRGMPPPGYNLEVWIAEYENFKMQWPAWAPKAQETNHAGADPVL